MKKWQCAHSFNKAWSIVKDVRYTEGGMHPCPQCEGRGQVQFTENDPQGNPLKINFVTCPSCNGTGQMTSEELIADKEAEDEWCICPEYNGMTNDRFGNQVPASPQQLQDWKDGVLLIEDEDEEGPYSYTVCGTCNGIVTAG